VTADPHPLARTAEIVMARDPLNELLVACAGCGQQVLVCGYVTDLPAPHRCIECRGPGKRPGGAAEAMQAARKAAGVA